MRYTLTQHASKCRYELQTLMDPLSDSLSRNLVCFTMTWYGWRYRYVTRYYIYVTNSKCDYFFVEFIPFQMQIRVFTSSVIMWTSPKIWIISLILVFVQIFHIILCPLPQNVHCFYCITITCEYIQCVPCITLPCYSNMTRKQILFTWYRAVWQFMVHVKTRI